MEDLLTPLSFEPSPGIPDPQSQGPSAANPRPSAASEKGDGRGNISENLRSSVANKKGRWGGPRPGAGAPRGNLNALRHGRNSRYHQQLLQLLAQIPQVRDTLIEIAKRRRRQQKQVESGAAALLAELLRRVGEIVLNPHNNQLENNQELLAFLRSADAQLRQMLTQQSSSEVATHRSNKRTQDGVASPLPPVIP